MVHHGGAGPAQGLRDDGGLTLAGLAELRGISRDAARRLVKAGKVDAHQVDGAHGREWCVHPDGRQDLADDHHDRDLHHDEDRQGGAGPAPGSRNGGAGVALAQAEAMASYTRSVLEPLVASLERSEARVAELERENGQLTAKLEIAQVTERPVQPILERLWLLWLSVAALLTGTLLALLLRVLMPS